MAHAIITPQEMYAAEQALFDTGVASFDVMRTAGEAVAKSLHANWSSGSVNVLCGPGGNGGDGFVAASHLAMLGRDVSVFLLGSPDNLTGDVARAAALWNGEVAPLQAALERPCEITLDALFGGGLSRPLSGVAAELAEATRSRVMAVDVPSGLDGLTARPLGACFRADRTVTFAALRPAHVLSPGVRLCGIVEVAEIGVPVPTHTQLRAIAKRDQIEAIQVSDPSGLSALMRESEPPPVNRIEAVRCAARHQRRSVLLKAPETLLALPSGQVFVDQES